MIAVDTNILVYLWVRGQFSESAEAALKKEQEWNAPRLWRSEFCNVLIGYLRRKGMMPDEVLTTIAGAGKQMLGREHDVQSDIVVVPALSSGCSSYDAEFVVLAKQLSVRLLTEDKEVFKKFPNIAVSLQNFVVS